MWAPVGKQRWKDRERVVLRCFLRLLRQGYKPYQSSYTQYIIQNPTNIIGNLMSYVQYLYHSEIILHKTVQN